MAEGAVVFVQSVTCPACGARSSAYLGIASPTEGTMACPRCGVSSRHSLPQHYVPQVPPAGLASYPGRGRMAHYPGLYNRPKETPRFDIGGLLRIAVLPSDGFQRLMVRTDFRHSMVVVIVTAFVGTIIAGLVSWSLLDELGYYTSNNLWLAAAEAVSFAVQLLTFFVFSFAGAFLSKGLFNGRGDYASTASLMGYAFVWYTAFSVVASVVFAGIRSGADSGDYSVVSDSLFALALLFMLVISGLVWLLWVSGRAVSVANDISHGEGALVIIISALIAGVVSIAVSAFVTLPIGISL